jgi:uncharacterized protein (DUF1778 family)
VTKQQILSIQSYILACAKYEAAHYLEKSSALMAMMEAQNRMHDLLLDPVTPEPQTVSEP